MDVLTVQAIYQRVIPTDGDLNRVPSSVVQVEMLHQYGNIHRCVNPGPEALPPGGVPLGLVTQLLGLLSVTSRDLSKVKL